MRVNEYIYRNWANWNFAILKELCEDEGIQWSEGLESYLKTTPTNTNWSMLVNFGIDPYGCDEGGDTVTILGCIDGEPYEVKIGDVLPVELFSCESCDEGEDVYYIANGYDSIEVEVAQGDVFTQEMASLAVDGVLQINHGCIR